MSNLINMAVRFCKDKLGNKFSPVVYEESMFNNDGTRMHPVPSRMIAKAYDPTQTYPTYSQYCINDNKYYKFTGSGTTTGAFDDTKWTETDAAEEFTALNSTLAVTSGISMEAITVKSGVSIDVMGSQILYKYGYFCFVHLCFQATGAISAGTVIFELPTGSYQGLGNYAAYATDGTVKTIDITVDGKIKNGIALASGVKLEFNAPCFRT